MLDSPNALRVADGSFERSSASTVDLDSVLAGARRQLKVMAGIALVVLALGVAFLLVAQPYFTGETDVLIDFSGRQFSTTSAAGDQAGLVFASPAIDSQVEVMKSDKLALKVIDRLKLTADPEFIDTSILSKMLGLFGINSSQSIVRENEERLRRRALETFKKRLNVDRVQKTFVISIEFVSREALKAAQIANALADVYLLDQLDAKFESARLASSWFQDRIIEVQAKSTAAEQAVQAYRRDNNLITANGRFLNDQQLAEGTAQLASARADQARVEAKYNRIRQIISNHEMDAAVSEALTNPVIVELRNKYLLAAKRVDELQQRLGPTHIQVQALQREMLGYEGQIFGELGRIAESYRSELDVSKRRVDSLAADIDKLTGLSANDNQTAVRLRQLEREAETYSTLHQNLMQKNQDLIQQQSFPVTEARVISTALIPYKPSYPKPLLVLAISILGAIFASVGVGILREYKDRVFRTGDDIRSDLRIEFFGIVPIVSRKVLTQEASRHHLQEGKPGLPLNPLFSSLLMPLSRLADTLRTAKVAIDLNQYSSKCRTVGIISSRSGEGKTFIAANLALLLGSMGHRVLLVDGDLRRSGLSHALAPDGDVGFADVVKNTVSLQSAVRSIGSNVSFLPAPASQRQADSSQLLGSEAAGRLITEQAAQSFEYVVIDLPPLSALVDAKAISPFVSSFVFVVKWGETPRELAQKVLGMNSVLHQKCVGGILNQANPKQLAQYVSGNYQDYGYVSY